MKDNLLKFFDGAYKERGEEEHMHEQDKCSETLQES